MALIVMLALLSFLSPAIALSNGEEADTAVSSMSYGASPVLGPPVHFGHMAARGVSTSSSTSSHTSSTTKKTSSTSTHASSTSKKTSSTSTHTSSSTKKSSTSSHPTTTITKSAASAVTTTTKSASTTTKKASSTSSNATASATGKRGLAYSNETLTAPWSGSGSEVTWAYNWYSSGGGSPETEDSSLTYIPMLWSNSEDLTNVWATNAQQAINQGADAVLAFNEPDLCYPGSSCMSVNESVSAYLEYIQPFAGKVELGAPAVTNVGQTWLSEFLGNCTECTIDFVPIHWYSNVYAFSYLQEVIEGARNITLQYYPEGKPIWLTEFGITDMQGTDAQIQAFLQEALAWLDSVPYVKRYAFFMDAPGYLMNSNGTGLSDYGEIYKSYTASCSNWDNDDGAC